MAGEIDARDHVEGCRRVAGRRDDIEGREHISDDFVALIDRDRRRRAFLGPKPLGTRRINHLHDLGRKPLAQLTLFGGRRSGAEGQRDQRDANAAGPVGELWKGNSTAHDERVPAFALRNETVAEYRAASGRKAPLRNFFVPSRNAAKSSLRNSESSV